MAVNSVVLNGNTYDNNFQTPLEWWQRLINLAGDLLLEAEAVKTAGFQSPSSTSLTIGLGTQSLTVGAGLFFAPGQYITVAQSVANVMYGKVTAYDSATGVLDVDVTGVEGAGTFANWTVTVSGAPGAGGGGSGETNTASNANTAGVGVYEGKTGVNLEFRGVKAGSTKATVALVPGENAIAVDVDPAQIGVTDLSGTPATISDNQLFVGSGGGMAQATMLQLAAGLFKVLGGVAFNVTNTTAAVATDSNHCVINTDASAGPIQHGLAQISTVPRQLLVFTKTDNTANTVTITPDGTETINGLASLALASVGESVIIQNNNGTNWVILAHYDPGASGGGITLTNNSYSNDAMILTGRSFRAKTTADLNGNAEQLIMASAFHLIWTASGSFGGTKDTGLCRAAAGAVRAGDQTGAAGTGAILAGQLVAEIQGAAPAATAGQSKIYTVDNGGTQELWVKFANDTTKLLANDT